MNDQEYRKLFELTEENNILLKKIKKFQLINTWIKGLYFFFLALFFFGGYIVFKPILSSLLDSYFKVFTEVEQISHLIK